jgi:hypothetical protein
MKDDLGRQSKVAARSPGLSSLEIDARRAAILPLEHTLTMFLAPGVILIITHILKNIGMLC